jgi:DNA-binding NarL/FixJ family response regulator
MDQLLNGSVNGGGSHKRGSRVHELTKREIQIIELVGLGMNNKAIAAELKITEATVRHHLSSIYSKLHVEDRLNLAIFAYQTKIVKPTGD